MSIVRHADVLQTRGYYSKILNRTLVAAGEEAKSCQVVEQIVPRDGYIAPHSHEFEETLTFLSGRAEVRAGDETNVVGPDTTVFLSPGVVHSVRNAGDEPVRLLAFMASGTPELRYPEGAPPEPAKWE